MHSSVGIEVAPANCVISQRFASWSYTTTGSPKPLLSQTPPKPVQRVAMSTGPKTEAPVVLSKTWKPRLTIWTYWSRPTSPFVSGGAQLQFTPGKAMPLKLRMVPGIFGLGIVLWTTGSRALLWSLNSKSEGFSAATCRGNVACDAFAMERTGCEMSFLYDLRTVTPLSPCFAGAAPAAGRFVGPVGAPPARTTLAWTRMMSATVKRLSMVVRPRVTERANCQPALATLCKTPPLFAIDSREGNTLVGALTRGSPGDP